MTTTYEMIDKVEHIIMFVICVCDFPNSRSSSSYSGLYLFLRAVIPHLGHFNQQRQQLEKTNVFLQKSLPKL